MAVTRSCFYPSFYLFYSGLFQQHLEPTALFVVPAFSDAAGISEVYEVTFYDCFGQVYTSTIWNMPTAMTYFHDPPFISPALSRVSIVFTWSRSTGSVPYRPTAPAAVVRPTLGDDRGAPAAGGGCRD